MEDTQKDKALSLSSRGIECIRRGKANSNHNPRHEGINPWIQGRLPLAGAMEWGIRNSVVRTKVKRNKQSFKEGECHMSTWSFLGGKAKSRIMISSHYPMKD